MEKIPTLNGTVEIYNASGEFSCIAGEKIKLDIANVKKFEEECPVDHIWSKIIVRISIVEDEV